MGRTPFETKHINLTIYLHPDDAAYVNELKKDLGKSTNADVFREIVRGLRFWFGLPSYMVEILRKDARSKGLNALDYIRDMLGRRYEEIQAEKTAAGGSKSK